MWRATAQLAEEVKRTMAHDIPRQLTASEWDASQSRKRARFEASQGGSSNHSPGAGSSSG